MKYVQAVKDWYIPSQREFSVFLAGGISNCPNWQERAVQRLMATNNDRMVIINPRRGEFDLSNPKEAERQIEWEFAHLHIANIIMFWFPCETLCPITLYEYGRWINSVKMIFAGCHPDYARKFDLIVQSRLEHKIIDFDLDKTLDRVVAFSKLYG